MKWVLLVCSSFDHDPIVLSGDSKNIAFLADPEPSIGGY